MGCCLSTSSRSTDDAGSSSCLEIGLCGQKKARRTFSDHVVSLQKLTSLPNRIFSNGKSRSSCIFTQQGRKGVNQDAMIVWEDFVSEDAIFCGVFDGHGPYGHLVARKVRDALPIKLLSFLDSSESRRSKASFKKEIKPESGEAEQDFSAEEEVSTMWREAFMKAYKAMDKELKSHANLDCFCSGSTSVTIVKQGSNLFMGNIGDSRAIMGSKDSNDLMVAIQLTVDLKPDLPNKDQFIVLASDGVWDVLSNEEVVEIVSSAPSRSSAARVIVESAAREWKHKYPTSKMDDCAVVCLFLDGKMNSEESDCDEQCYSSATIQTNNDLGNPVESDEGQKSEPSLRRNYTVRSTEGIERCVGGESVNVEDGTSTAEEQSWLGLEGVTRVNSLVQLPRFSEEKPNS
ncbi:hypothetical protein TSUD_104850 [Trifolium subterraneum]|uniref:PPM-type phosphatase domain-containing protein n=1 Tax=Trifolium subterraneum TaxID=3900 RepID=A0A2Z6MTX4_TRISU|nr:hypothetical protein TSUD_104850 [Trifolium subterraneum]